MPELAPHSALYLTCAERLAEQARRSEALACQDRAEQVFPGSSRTYRHRFGLDPPTP